MREERLTGEIYVDDISELVQNVNNNKDKMSKVIFDRRGDHWVFEILNDDSKDSKKIFKEIEKFIRKIDKKEGKKNKVKREKDNLVTDEVIE